MTDNVTPIGKARKPKEKKPSMFSIYETIRVAIERGKHSGVAFPAKLRVIEPIPGQREAIVIDDFDVATRISVAAVGRYINKFLVECQFPELELLPKQCKEAAEHWLASTAITEQPSLFLHYNEPGICWNRIHIHIPDVTSPDDALAHAPTARELFGRMTNPEGALAYIGALLDREALIQQYLWIHGKGGDGKGALLNVLDHVFGSAYKPVPAPSKGGAERFWSCELRDVRVAVDSDTPSSNTAFVSSGHFRSVVGGNSVRMEGKNIMAKKESTMAGFIFCSNYEPQISDLKADRRRLIYTYITPPSDAQLEATKGHEQDYQRALLDEAPWILAAARATYNEKCPRKGLIPVSADDGLEIVSVEDDEFARLYDKLFIPTGDITDADLVNSEFMRQCYDHQRPERSAWGIGYVIWDDVSYVLRYLAQSQAVDIRKFKRYCQAHKGVIVGRNKNSKESRTRWIGVEATASFKSILRYRSM